MNLMDEKKRLLLALAVFPLTLLLLLIFRGAIREWIVVPLLSLVWFLNQAVLGVYQGILWFIFLIGASIFFFISLKQFYVSKERYEVDRRKPAESGKVRYWANLVYLSRRGRVSLPYITSRLREELFALIAYRHNLKPAEVQQRVEAGILSIPDDIWRFLFMQDKPYENQNIFADLAYHLRTFLPAQNRGNRDWIMKKIERTITYMEEIMEINNASADR
jgi:hypothetical protein